MFTGPGSSAGNPARRRQLEPVFILRQGEERILGATMLRFTIRDLLWLTVVVAVLVAGLINWRVYVQSEEKLREEVSDLRGSNFELGMELAAARSFPRGEKRIRELSEAAKKGPCRAMTPQRSCSK